MEANFDLGKQLEEDEKTLEKEVKAIIPLDLLAREIEIKRIAKEFDVRKTIIDQYIKEFVKKEQEGGSPEVVTDVEPYEEEVDGAMLLDSISAELLKYVILPSGAAKAIAAWTVLTYSSDAFRILPLLGITSPVKRCDKTTLLEVLQGLSNKGLTASNISPAAVFRTIDRYHPTLLIDEADTFLKDNDELRGVLNSGHTKTTAFVIRVEGESLEPVKFSTWGPKAISMIGTLPETLQDRSVVIKLRRKMSDERSAKLDIDFESECIDIRRKCQRWADDNLNKLTVTRPEMPQTNNDRMADNWMPLFAIRIGELQALKWHDIDFNKRTIEVKRSYRKGRMTGTKNHKRRWVDMTLHLTETFKAHRTAQKRTSLEAGKPFSKFVFTGKRNETLNRISFKNALIKCLKKAELRRIRTHALRHSYATIRLMKGHNVGDVSYQLGHSSINITYDVYAHWIPGKFKSEVDELDNVQPTAPYTHPVTGANDIL